MKNFYLGFLTFLALTACSNSPELETGEIKTFQLLKEAYFRSNNSSILVDSRDLISREQIDSFGIPILFVELDSGKNGTLTQYPGEGFGQTWLGADGATITLDHGVLMASRGMGDDLMSSISQMPNWMEIKNKNNSYAKNLDYLSGNNKIITLYMKCKVSSNYKSEIIKIWDVSFIVKKYEEKCTHKDGLVTNEYYLDDRMVVRKSRQFHSPTLGYIITERIDR